MTSVSGFAIVAAPRSGSQYQQAAFASIRKNPSLEPLIFVVQYCEVAVERSTLRQIRKSHTSFRSVTVNTFCCIAPMLAIQLLKVG